MKDTIGINRLKTIDAEGYETSSIQDDLRRDLHLYVEHIKNRTRKRLA